MSERGIVIVYTGGGKGKTSAALGLVLRAVGYNHKVCMVQFVKGSWHYGELDSAKRLAPEFEMITAGKGFVGILDDKSPREDHEKAANFEKMIDSPLRVVMKIVPEKWITFDGARMAKVIVGILTDEERGTMLSSDAERLTTEMAIRGID